MTRGWSDHDRARFAAEREAKLTHLQEQLATGVHNLMAADGWLAWLQIARHFHTYSLNNQLLIAIQNPTATQVAGYRAWQAAGRQVRKGETGIKILAPITRPRTTDDGQPILDEHGNPARGIVGFTPATVFDISQTDGPPLPHPRQGQPLTGPAPEGMWDNLRNYAHLAGYTTSIGPCPAEGMTNYQDHTITIRDGFDPAHATSVLAHEIGHVSMHGPYTPLIRSTIPCRGMIEVEAESFGWLVNQDWGLDSTTDSFAYLAGWATKAATDQHTTPEQILTNSAELIRTAVTNYLNYRHPEPAEHPVETLGQQLQHAITRTRPTLPARATHWAQPPLHSHPNGPTP